MEHIEEHTAVGGTVDNILAAWEIPLNVIENFKKHDITPDCFKFLITNESYLKEVCPHIGQRIKLKCKIEEYLVSVAETESRTTVTNEEAIIIETNCPELLNEQSNIMDISFNSDIFMDVAGRLTLPEFDLKTILQSSPHGNSVLNYYTKYKCLNSQKRNIIVDILVKYHYTFIINNNIKPEEFNLIAAKIVALFPTESIYTYYMKAVPTSKSALGRYVPAKGKLVDKVRNLLYISGTKRRSAQTSTSSSATDVTCNQELSSNSDAIWLKHNDEPWEQVIDKWNNTYDLRRKENVKTVFDFIETWKILKNSKADTLIFLDFERQYKEKSLNFYKNWEPFFSKILTLRENIVSNVHAKTLINILEDITDDDKKIPVQMYLLGYLIPPKGRKSRKIKISTTESIEGLLIQTNNAGDIDNVIKQQKDKAAAQSDTVQPYVLLQGPLENFSQIYIIIDDIIYHMQSAAKAFDLLFKIYHVFHAKYPRVAEHLHLVIQKKISNTEHEKLTQPVGYRSSWSFYLVLCGVVTTLGSSLPVGYNIGVVNTPAELIKRFCNESVVSRYDVELSERWLDTLWSCVVSIFIVGGCTGSVLGGYCADSLGRKKATIATSILSLVGALLFLLCRAANSVEMLILGRLIVGLSAGLTTSIVPMYLTELSPLSLSGAMGVACPMGVNVGVLAGQVMGLKFLLGGDDHWPYLLSVYALLVIICLPVLFILPESPKYLFVIRKNEQTALKELSRLRGVSPSLLVEDLDLLRAESLAAAQASSGQAWGMLRVLLDRRLRLPLLLACSMQAGQQTSGINAVFYYSTTIFKQAGLSPASSQYATIGCGAVNVATAVLMVYLLPRVGRRPLLLGSVTAAAVLLAALGACMNFLQVSGMSYVCIVAVLGYVIAYGFGLGPIPYFIASEIFEVGPRGAGMAWGSLANWAGNFLVGMCFPPMRDALGAYSFIVFAAVTAALAAFQKLYFPETRGKTPAQVAQLCSRGFRSRPARA